MTEALEQTRAYVGHPLTALNADEILNVRRLVVEGGKANEHTRFAYVGLLEPDKASVLNWQDGDPLPRRARALTLDLQTGQGLDLVVNLTDRSIETVAELDAETGGTPILDSDHDRVREILENDEAYKQAIARRGVDIKDTVNVALSAGSFDIPGEEGRRLMRSFAFFRHNEQEMPWAYPIDGLVAYVDTVSREVVEIIDDALYPIPAETGEFTGEEVTGPLRTSLKPIEITQPEGPSFSVDGELVEWENWSLRVGFDAREGLVLKQIAFDDKGKRRPIIYRASIAEMVVPYGDPSATRFWQNYFDTGEYIFGRYTNSLELGCDCLGQIHYVDAVVADENGAPRTIKNAVCMHEEDYGILWKHTDMFTGQSEVRRQRRLVISFFTTVGNYDYGFYWYLYLDGTIECEAKLTGIVFAGAHPEKDYPYTSEIAPGLGAPFHQHLFSARLDMTVDGVANSVVEVDAKRVPMGPGNPYGNGFTKTETTIRSEKDGGRLADGALGRTWHIVNKDSLGRLGQPAGYVLIPEENPVLLADPASSIASRANFATKHLWVTAYSPEERYPSGDYVNQHRGGAGLPEYMAADRPLEQEDIVLWHTFGPTHYPRPEDWPIMPVDYAKFTLKPFGFFDRNPTLDVPASRQSHCGNGDKPGSCH